MTGIVNTPDGLERWNETAIRQRKPLVPGAVWLNFKNRSWVLHNGDVTLATVRRLGVGKVGGYVVRVYGHEYLVTPEMQIAKNGWPVGTYVPIKNFSNATLAKREVMRVLRTMPTSEKEERL